MTKRKVILFELNEVPYKVLDDFCAKYPESFLARLMPRVSQYTTIAKDEGELSPWKTWPSLHRGVANSKHGINDFGQNLNTVDREYPPIWKILAEHKLKAGVFGSLHSYPLPDQVENFAFYVPDPFAQGPDCYPKEIASFQEFNLYMSRRSSRNVSADLGLSKATKVVKDLPRLGIKFRTVAQVAGQVAREIVQPWSKVRRRSFQGVLAFDVFMKQISKQKPNFATFFTNHCASAMHRYWAAAYPGDYSKSSFDKSWVKTYENEIDFNMKRTDEMVKRLVEFTDHNPDYKIVIASSMGQAATDVVPQSSQLYLTDLAKFMAAIGMPADSWKPLPAMLPQTNVLVEQEYREKFINALQNVLINGKNICFRQKEDGFFSLDFGQSNLEESKIELVFLNRKMGISEFGLENLVIEDKSGASAYHIPEGILLIYDCSDMSPDKLRRHVSALDIAPAILSGFGIKPPKYMSQVPEIAL